MTTLDEKLKPSKTARLEIKTTDFAKEFIRRAATVSGLDMTAFIMASAFEKAETVMENHRRIELSEKAFSRLHEILNEEDTDATPTPELLKLMRGQHGQRKHRSKPRVHD